MKRGFELDPPRERFRDAQAEAAAGNRRTRSHGMTADGRTAAFPFAEHRHPAFLSRQLDVKGDAAALTLPIVYLWQPHDLRIKRIENLATSTILLLPPGGGGVDELINS